MTLDISRLHSHPGANMLQKKHLSNNVIRNSMYKNTVKCCKTKHNRTASDHE